MDGSITEYCYDVEDSKRVLLYSGQIDSTAITLSFRKVLLTQKQLLNFVLVRGSGPLTRY